MKLFNTAQNIIVIFCLMLITVSIVAVAIHLLSTFALITGGCLALIFTAAFFLAYKF